MSPLPKALVRCHPRFAKHAADELRDALVGHSVSRLEAGVLGVMTATDVSPDDVVARVAARRPVFAEHVMPVHADVHLTGHADVDLARLAATVTDGRIPHTTGPLAVECRRLESAVSGRHLSSVYTARDVEVAVGSALERGGTCIDLAAPEVVVHVVLADDVALIGIVRVRSSLRRWADPMRRASPTRICRAEHKLLQALETFGLRLRPGGRALDLGAAPGGWSHVLAAAGLSVDAVDPALLDERVASDPAVSHVRQRAETLDLAVGTYDLVVNDMALDPDASAAVMVATACAAKPAAPGVLTVKLPTLNVGRWTTLATDALGDAWTIVDARHLAANRQEVTWLLRRSTERLYADPIFAGQPIRTDTDGE
jgi:23S rRNA (cytidine2498-2'-O)-methyltransferase